MTIKARLGCWIALGALSFAFAPAAAWAGPTNSDKPSDLVFWHSQLELIKQEESRGNWSKAYEFYAYLLSIDRNQPEIKKLFLHSLRNLHRRYRHSDVAFRQGLLNPQFRLTESLDFYRDMVRRVQELYQDADQVRIARLFDESVTELILALDDPEFRKLYLKDVNPALVLEFRNYLDSTYARNKLRVTGLTEAVEQVRVIAKEASRRLGKPGQLFAVEMACGVCNCLDEHSFYLTPSDLVSGHLDRTVEFSPVENGVGLIRIYGFQESSTIQELDVAIDQFRMAGMKVLILDLRNNGGGSLDVAVQVAERFLNAPAPIATLSGKVSKTFQSFSIQSVDSPLIVLVDRNTASAAELLAGALKAHGRAELVGQTTYGKSEVQKLVRFDLGPQGGLRVTWARFQIHKTHDLAKEGGIAPDLAVSPATTMGAPDTQLDAARSRARSLMMR